MVVADHERFDYAELRTATQAVLRGAALIGLTRDRTFPMPDGRGRAAARCSRRSRPPATARADEVVGKPEPGMYDTARDRLGEGRVLAIGDRLDVDVAGARRAGMDSALVLTGATETAAAAAAPTPPPPSSPTRWRRWC